MSRLKIHQQLCTSDICAGCLQLPSRHGGSIAAALDSQVLNTMGEAQASQARSTGKHGLCIKRRYKVIFRGRCNIGRSDAISTDYSTSRCKNRTTIRSSLATCNFVRITRRISTMLSPRSRSISHRQLPPILHVTHQWLLWLLARVGR
jgi:hypothetical protein